MMDSNLKTKRIVFFDGVCHLCNGFVDRTIRLDKGRTLLFAPLQGKTAEALLPKEQRESLQSLLYYDNGRVYSQSDAIIRIGRNLPFPHSLSWIMAIVPRFIRDFFYAKIAANRYSLFGKSEFCRLPESHEKEYLLL